MDTVVLVLFMLLLVGVSNVLVRIVRLPLPLLQIALGAALAGVPRFGIHVTLDPEIFLFLFIPPLLFSDGWRIPKREFFREKRSILMLAFGLVLFTVVGAGWFIHWMIPAIALPPAFALAAVLSPTDTVAVTVISGHAVMPQRLLYILQGESLLNDASGLVAFKFALAAALTGTFSLRGAAVDFVYIAVSGLGVGALLAVIADRGRHYLMRWRGLTPGTYIIVTLLLPFTAYMVAEAIGGSGILAAAAGGIALNLSSFTKDSSLEMRIQNATIWGLLEMTFNGVIFILLGLQLPGALGHARMHAAQAGAASPWWLLVYVLAITAALFLLRFTWVWVSFKLTLLRVSRRHSHGHKPPATHNRDLESLTAARAKNPRAWRVRSARLITATSLAGVRGAVTLAGILSVPLLMENGTPFPGRDLLIFLASGVILVSLLAGSFGLPFILRNLHMPAENAATVEEREARRRAAEAAIKAISATADSPELLEKLPQNSGAPMHGGAALNSELKKDLCDRVIALYRQRLGMVSEDETVKSPARHVHTAELELRLQALRAERTEIFRLYETRLINNQTLGVLLNELDMSEAALLGTNVTHW